MLLNQIKRLAYPLSLAAVQPLNLVLSWLLKRRYVPGSVLHVSYMGHVPFHTVQTLRAHGVKANYLAVGDSPIWSAADFHMQPSWLPPFTIAREMWMVWRVLAQHEIVHAHFMVTVTRTGWELPWLRRMGRKLVVHYRGCEVRDRTRLVAAHPDMNICQDCDYVPRTCEAEHNVARRRLADAYANAVLVTTPDLQEFASGAEHMPFFAPSIPPNTASRSGVRPFRIVHATNHPGIEGTARIRAAVDALRQKGFDVDLQVLSGATQAEVLAALTDADLAIGKMKMGYYANAQIESMAAGVPTITYVRQEFMTPALERSGFIFATLDTLHDVVEHYLTHPEALRQKREQARRSILELHDNATISARYVNVYRRVCGER